MLGSLQQGKIRAMAADKLTIVTRLSPLFLAHRLTEKQSPV